jgi:hypothetical protein
LIADKIFPVQAHVMRKSDYRYRIAEHADSSDLNLDHIVFL